MSAAEPKVALVAGIFTAPAAVSTGPIAVAIDPNAQVKHASRYQRLLDTSYWAFLA